MSNADGPSERFDPAGIDADLFRIFSVQPSGQALAALDLRMERSLRERHHRRLGLRRLRPGRRAGMIGLLAASFAVLGATGSLQGLYTFLWGPFDTPWHRGTEVNLSQVVNGYRVTIDRAYGDAARLALAISVVDEQRRPGISQVMAMSTIVTDAAGEYTSGGGAVSSPDGPFAAVNVVWKTPPVLPVPSGPRMIHVVMPFIMVRDDATPPPDPDLDPTVEGDEWNPWHEVAGPWTFDFELDIDGGTAVTPLDATADAGGHTVVVEQAIVTPSIVRVDIAVDPGRPGDWSPIGEVQHNGRVAPFVVGSFQPGGRTTLMTDGGLGDASGSWTVVVTELVGGDQRIAGPWTITFTVP